MELGRSSPLGEGFIWMHTGHADFPKQIMDAIQTYASSVFTAARIQLMKGDGWQDE